VSLRSQWTVRAASLILAALIAFESAAAQDDAAAARHAGVQAIYPVMLKAVEAGDFAQARLLCEHAITMEPSHSGHRYNLACIEARAGDLRRSLAALEQAIQLGFNDRSALDSDPDLAAIRSLPKFAVLLQRLAPSQKTAPLPSAPPREESVEVTPIAQAPTPTPNEKIESPAPASFNNGAPIGLYFMTRFWPATSSLEKAAWYFAPDGTVYRNLAFGFSTADLASHIGPKGTYRGVGDKLEVTWSTGKTTSSVIKSSGRGFSWDAGLFSAVQPFQNEASLAGRYEGGESLSTGTGRAALSKTLELHVDGTFTWQGVSLLGATSKESQVTAGAIGTASRGTWRFHGYSLVLTEQSGNVFRRIAFPYDDEKTTVNPDRIFFGGILYNKKQ
jgi:hypothetical protein